MKDFHFDTGFVDVLLSLSPYIPSLFIVVGLVFAIVGLDDLFIDLLAVRHNKKPKKISENEFTQMLAVKEKQIAIMIPAWDESKIIKHMLTQNIRRLNYKNYHIFVGVYPNDLKTLNEVKKTAKIYKNVHPVVNTRTGPTSKGQMLNQAIREIRKYEPKNQIIFDAIAMQDAEDILHPQSLKLANLELSDCDFLQTPVFSLPVSRLQLVGGVYMDEFAEKHTKDILVRSHLNASIPSAGVGTVLSRKLIDIKLTQDGEIFNEGSLTEDYELGLTTRRLNLRSKFVCKYFLDPITGKKNFIATREYFPKNFYHSIRQKTRWSLGIVFQGWQNLGWFGDLKERYFLYRDRKTVLTNVSSLAGYILATYIIAMYCLGYKPLQMHSFDPSLINCLAIVNLAHMINRSFHRALCTSRIYGLSQIIPMFCRWPIAILINSFASFRSISQFFVNIVANVPLKWAKTDHELPDFSKVEV